MKFQQLLDALQTLGLNHDSIWVPLGEHHGVELTPSMVANALCGKYQKTDDCPLRVVKRTGGFSKQWIVIEEEVPLEKFYLNLWFVDGTSLEYFQSKYMEPVRTIIYEETDQIVRDIIEKISHPDYFGDVFRWGFVIETTKAALCDVVGRAPDLVFHPYRKDQKLVRQPVHLEDLDEWVGNLKLIKE